MSTNVISTVIFDMDGVISDTQDFLAKCESRLLAQYDINLSADHITEVYGGTSEDFFFRDIFKKADQELNDISKLIKERRELIMSNAKGQIKEIPGSIDLIKLFDSEGFDIALASGSNLDFIDLVLEELSVRSYFKTIVSSEEVELGKPSPDIFLLTAKRLNVEPMKCLVIEDGKNGMIGAKKAGMKCFGLVKNIHDKSYPADKLVDSLDKITIEMLNSL